MRGRDNENGREVRGNRSRDEDMYQMYTEHNYYQQSRHNKQNIIEDCMQPVYCSDVVDRSRYKSDLQ